jgi:hypothetical protein
VATFQGKITKLEISSDQGETWQPLPTKEGATFEAEHELSAPAQHEAAIVTPPSLTLSLTARPYPPILKEQSQEQRVRSLWRRVMGWK